VRRSFPRSAEDITPQWLTGVLRDAGALAPRAVVESVTVESIAAGFGQTSETTRLWATTSPAGERMSIIVKAATADDHRRAIARQAQMYRTEVRFYRDIAARIRTRVPRCYLAEIDDVGEHFLMLLEDFRGHRPGDEVSGLALSDARLAVTQMARLHAAFWDSNDNARLANEPARLPPDMLDAGWQTMMQSFGADIPDGIADARADYLASAPALHDWMTTGPTTIAHGDFRLDNLLFGAESGPVGDRIVVLDWQGISRSRGIRDFAYLISHSMPVADRRQHELGLLREYLAELARNGVAYDEECALHDYRMSMLYLIHLVVWITGVHVNSNLRANERKRALVRRAFTAILDQHALALLPARRPDTSPSGRS
jgi:aminoglycoside phosphotransferase (APT) family kinase protein